MSGFFQPAGNYEKSFDKTDFGVSISCFKSLYHTFALGIFSDKRYSALDFLSPK
jgi:hypothetical protein